MAKRENVHIVTKYRSIDAFRDKVIDREGQPRSATTWNRGLWGQVEDNGDFTITSGNKGAAIFIYRGQGQVIDGQVHMNGDIEVLPKGKWTVYISILLMTLIGIAMILSANVVLVFMGLLMMVFPWTNYFYMTHSDALYKIIIQKVCG